MNRLTLFLKYFQICKKCLSILSLILLFSSCNPGSLGDESAGRVGNGKNTYLLSITDYKPTGEESSIVEDESFKNKNFYLEAPSSCTGENCYKLYYDNEDKNLILKKLALSPVEDSTFLRLNITLSKTAIDNAFNQDETLSIDFETSNEIEFQLNISNPDASCIRRWQIGEKAQYVELSINNSKTQGASDCKLIRIDQDPQDIYWLENFHVELELINTEIKIDDDAEAEAPDPSPEPAPEPQVPEIELYDFGGMFGDGYINPATGAETCPPNYITAKFRGGNAGTQIDKNAYFCYKAKSTEGSAIDFGGMFGASYLNPITNKSSCPVGFTASSVSGTATVDNYAAFCWRPKTQDGGFKFGGIWASNLNNPITGSKSCPLDYSSAGFIGTSNVDHYRVFCYHE